MNVILTWSQKYSHEIALFLRDWLADVMPATKPWVSSEDIQKGKKWFQELMAQFDESRVSIICVTAENVRSPWVFYEVGMIAAKQQDGIVCPYLVGISGKLIQGTPLSEFQWTEADKQDTWKLIRSINKELKENGYDEKVLQGKFNSQWPRLKSKLEKITSDMGQLEEEVTQVYQPRDPDLGPKAKKLLLDASKDPNGLILFSRTFAGTSIQTANKQLISSQDPREVAGWKNALSELEKHEYVKPLKPGGDVFEVTDLGFKRAETLMAEDPAYALCDEAKQILTATSEASDGFVHFVTFDGGFQIMTNQRQFIEGHTPEEAAKWKHAFDQLVEAGFVEPTHQESLFRITKKGYEIVKQIGDIG